MALPAPRWIVCALLLLATTLNYLDRVALNQLINPIMAEFALNDRDYARMESAFDIAFGLGTLFAGWLVDRVNVRWVYPVVVLGWSLAGFCTGYASTFSMLLMCRVMLGFFEAGNWPCGIRTTRTVLAPAERSFGNALFQSGTALGAILAPLMILECDDLYLRFYEQNCPWTVPFRVIGLIGFGWIGFWLLFAPPRLFTPPEPRSHFGNDSFWRIFRDLRFWVLVLVIIGVNTGWHTVRVWMPRLLKEQYAFDQKSLQWFSIWYYLASDLGSWTVGLATLILAGKGFSLIRVRIGCFLACTALLSIACGILPSLAEPRSVCAALIVVGFAALGLFPTYFALSQELSAKHQGKITGTLGCINALYLAGMQHAEGWFVSGGYFFEYVIAFSSLPALIASVALLLFWNRESKTSA